MPEGGIGASKLGEAVASYNDEAVQRAKQLIEARQYVFRSEWRIEQPSADDENDYLDAHG